MNCCQFERNLFQRPGGICHKEIAEIRSEQKGLSRKSEIIYYAFLISLKPIHCRRCHCHHRHRHVHCHRSHWTIMAGGCHCLLLLWNYGRSCLLCMCQAFFFVPWPLSVFGRRFTFLLMLRRSFRSM